MDRGDGFDLVLMDIDLGDGMDGTEAARQILLRRNVPIVFLTSHMEKEYVDRAKAISSYGYVVKDTGEFVLIQSIEMALRLFEATASSKAREQALAERVKELSCLYKLEALTKETNLSVEEILRRTGEVLAAATQYPKACRVDISILGAEREVRHVDPLIEVAIEVDTYADLAGVVVPPPLS